MIKKKKKEEEPLKSINTILTIVPKTQKRQYGELFY